MKDEINIILIVIDTLRKDYAEILERNLTRLGFYSYNNVIAPASWTLPSHVSLFTGLYPAFHGVHETKDKKHIDIKIPNYMKPFLINNLLNDIGYSPIMLTANVFITPHFGFDGFEYIFETMNIPFYIHKIYYKKYDFRYIIDVPVSIKKHIKELRDRKDHKLLFETLLGCLKYKTYKFIKGVQEKGSLNTMKILGDILRENKKEKLFLFINLMEAHEPYNKKEDIDKIFLENITTNNLDRSLVINWRKKYFEEVKYITKQLLKILSILKENGLYDKSLIIITSDHGQLLGEHNRISHGTFLYEELLRVPLLIKYPKKHRIERLCLSDKYISLINIKSLIMGIINNEIKNDVVLYDDFVFSESYGVHQRTHPKNVKEKENINKLEKYKIAIYYHDLKGIFNVNDWKFEKVFSYKNREITKKEKNELKNKIIDFLKIKTTKRKLKNDFIKKMEK